MPLCAQVEVRVCTNFALSQLSGLGPRDSRTGYHKRATTRPPVRLSMPALQGIRVVEVDHEAHEVVSNRCSFDAEQKTGEPVFEAAVGAPSTDGYAMSSQHARDAMFSGTTPLTVEWRRINATVTVPDPTAKRSLLVAALRAPPTRKRLVLHDVEGRVDAGAMVGLLGPSGSGKTTLLSVLGRRSTAAVTGQISINGERGLSKSTRRRIGFVTQDDTLWTSLSVSQTLLFAAQLRLPDAMPRAAKLARVEHVIELLGLTHCKDTPIGGALKRGLSGGERKRTSVGLELLTNPSIVLADEPSSGLDSTIALRLLTTLRQLSIDTGCGFLITIHQPASRLFTMFDSVLLLAEGRTIFNGAPGAVQSYFSPLSFAMPPDTNPADWLLDLASGDSSIGGREALVRLTKAYTAAHPVSVARPDDDDADLYGTMGGEQQLEGAKWPTSFWTQTVVLARRNVAARAEGAFDAWKVGQVLVVAILSGLLWLSVGRSKELSLAQVGDTSALSFFILVFPIFLSLFGSLFAFPSERAITIKERKSGLFRMSAYYIARTASDLPLDLGLPAVFVVLIYFMAGLKTSAFLPFLLLILLTVLVASSLGLFISAMSNELKQAQAFASVSTLLLMLCSGFYIQGIPGWLSWLKWVSFINLAYEAALKVRSTCDHSERTLTWRAAPIS